jgi:hypothetical protein
VGSGQLSVASCGLPAPTRTLSPYVPPSRVAAAWAPPGPMGGGAGGEVRHIRRFARPTMALTADR